MRSIFFQFSCVYKFIKVKKKNIFPLIWPKWEQPTSRLEFLSGIALSIYEVGLKAMPERNFCSQGKMKVLVSTQNLRLTSNFCRERNFLSS